MTPARAANFWPTAEQELILRAALLPAAAAVDAWAALRPALDLDRLDGAAQRLLPLLQRNLRRLGIDDPRLARCRGVHHYYWSRNQMLFHRAGTLVGALAREGIATMLLKGAALVEGYYRDPGLRPMNDFDLAILPADAGRAIDVLRRRGWSPRYAITPSFLRVKHAGLFEDSGGHHCDLHWHIFEECVRPDDDDDLWAAAPALEFTGHPTRVLAPTDQLLHVCVHGAKWAPEPGIRWIADAMLVLEGGGIDWSRLAAQATRRRFVLRLRDALGFLRGRFEAPVPDAVLADLAARPASTLERLERRILDREHRRLGQLPVYWCHHRRTSTRAALGTALTFPRFLQHAWGAETIRAVPLAALIRTWRRLGRRSPAS